MLSLRRNALLIALGLEDWLLISDSRYGGVGSKPSSYDAEIGGVALKTVSSVSFRLPQG